MITAQLRRSTRDPWVEYRGWHHAELHRSIESITGAFELTALGTIPFAARKGDLARILVDGELQLDGFVDEVSGSTGDDWVISGRDHTGDLVDCSWPGPFEFINTTPRKLIETVLDLFDGVEPGQAKVQGRASRFNLRWDLETDGTPEDLAIDPGENAYSVIDRMLRKLRALAFTEEGRVVVGLIGRTRSASLLKEDKERGNILQCSFVFSDANRYSSYTAESQIDQKEDLWADKAASIASTIPDPRITRFRPLVFFTEGEADEDACRERALWERTVRAAQSNEVQVNVFGHTALLGRNVSAQGERRSTTGGEVATEEFRLSKSAVWNVNRLVGVQIPSIGMDLELLVKEVTFITDEGSGDETSLTLAPRDSFNRLEDEEPAISGVNVFPSFPGGLLTSEQFEKFELLRKKDDQ